MHESYFDVTPYHLSDSRPTRRAPALVSPWGLIFFLYDHDGRRFVGHTGSQKAFQSFLYIDPAAGTAAIAAFNTDAAGTPRRPDTRTILTGLRTRLFDSAFPLWPERRRTSSN